MHFKFHFVWCQLLNYILYTRFFHRIEIGNFDIILIVPYNNSIVDGVENQRFSCMKADRCYWIAIVGFFLYFGLSNKRKHYFHLYFWLWLKEVWMLNVPFHWIHKRCRQDLPLPISLDHADESTASIPFVWDHQFRRYVSLFPCQSD